MGFGTDSVGGDRREREGELLIVMKMKRKSMLGIPKKNQIMFESYPNFY